MTLAPTPDRQRPAKRRHSTDPDRPLSERMRRFCQAYLDEPTITAAAISAGYAPRSAYEQGSKLLKNTRIARHIAQLRREALNARGIDRSWVLTRLSDIAVDSGVAGQARVRAIELIGRDLGMFQARSTLEAHVVVHRATPRLNSAPLAPELAAKLSGAMEAIDAEATLVSESGKAAP